MGLFDRFRSNDEEPETEDENEEPEFEEVTETREIRHVITNKRATLGIKGEDERIIEYDVLDNGEFARADGWSWRTRGWGSVEDAVKNGSFEVDIEEWETVLEVNHQYLKYIDPVWEHEQTLVTEIEVTYKQYEDGKVKDAEVEELDAWVEGGDTTES